MKDFALQVTAVNSIPRYKAMKESTELTGHFIPSKIFFIYIVNSKKPLKILPYFSFSQMFTELNMHALQGDIMSVDVILWDPYFIDYSTVAANDLILHTKLKLSLVHFPCIHSRKEIA